MGFGIMQDEMQKMQGAMNDKFQSMEASFARLMETVTSPREGEASAPRGSQRTEGHPGNNSGTRGENVNSIVPHNRHVKLEFPKFKGGDPTSWLSKARQYFAYQEMPTEHRVNFALYYLEDVANEWWQATSNTLEEERIRVTWEVIEEELWAHFRPTRIEDFDEALYKITQKGTLREYYREFERLQNKVTCWTQIALMGTYIGSLKDSISDCIRMFQPTTLKATIELAHMSEDQLQRTRKFMAFHILDNTKLKFRNQKCYVTSTTTETSRRRSRKVNLGRVETEEEFEPLF